MQASAYAFDVEAGFDRAAAEAYLRELRGQSAQPRRASRPSRQQAIAQVEAPLVAPPLRRPSRRKSHSRTIAAIVMAIAAPASIGAGVLYWTASKPADSATAATPLRDTPTAAPRAVMAYSVTDPVSADPNPRSDGASHGPAKSWRARPAARTIAVSAQAEEQATDYPSYGILDPTPAAPRAADAAAN